MSNEIEYLAKRRGVIVKNKQKEINSNPKKTELHHILGKRNSDEKVCLCMPCHDYITCVQNSYPVEIRKNNELMALISLKGILKLTLKHLSEFIELKVNKTTLSKLK